VSPDDSGAGFMSRWSRRKALARQGAVTSASATTSDPAATTPIPPAAAPTIAVAASPDTAQTAQQAAAGASAPAAQQPPPPTLADVAGLTRESDYSRFVASDVDCEVKNAALKKLFGDPRFNVMDGLDVYIDDYSKADPLPSSIARQLAQAAFLGLVEAEPAKSPSASAANHSAASPPHAMSAQVASEGCVATPVPDENADLRLQSHDATGCGGAEDGAAADGTSQL
jgi:uncharacterized protein DUF3306